VTDDNRRTGEAARSRYAAVTWASNIRPQPQIWLWDNRIPIGTVSALAGRGGTGKTTYAIHVAAQLSRGLLPGKYYGDPRPTLIWSGEDAWAPVLVPRAIAAGADLNLIGQLSIESDHSGATWEVTPRIPLDTGTIRDAINGTGAALVIIDPIASTMTGDLHREADVRCAIDALARLADETSAVVLFVRHFGKGGGNASDKMSGSHAFRDAVRSVFLFAEDGDRVVVTQDKGNYAPPGAESFAFKLDGFSVPTKYGPAEVARVVELGSCDTSVGDVINRAPDQGGNDDDAEIDAWLTELLANGPVKATEVYSAVDAAGYSKDQAKRAKKRLKIDAVKTGDGPWLWNPPTKGAEEQGSTPGTRQRAPLLPSRSEGVREAANQAREQGEGECSLDAPKPSVMPPKGPHAALITSSRHRTRGRHRCACGAALERADSIKRGHCAECALTHSKHGDPT